MSADQRLLAIGTTAANAETYVLFICLFAFVAAKGIPFKSECLPELGARSICCTTRNYVEPHGGLFTWTCFLSSVGNSACPAYREKALNKPGVIVQGYIPNT